MKTSIEAAWETAARKAASTPPQEGEYIIFRIDEHSERNIYGGVDDSGNPLLAIETRITPPNVNLRSASLSYLRRERKGTAAWLMVLFLKRKELATVFAKLCQDLIEEAQGAQTEEALVDLTMRRILLWQKLFENKQGGLLADFQVKGLLAELLFMESRLDAGACQPLELAKAWTGPCGGDQDFVFADEAVEVKAVGMHVDDVGISSLQQLDSRVALRLSVWTLRPAAPTESGAVGLNQIAIRLEQKLAKDPEALAGYREALLEAGYVANENYDELMFQVMDVEDFVVDADFPRLTACSVPSGILSATYRISLNAIRMGAGERK